MTHPSGGRLQGGGAGGQGGEEAPRPDAGARGPSQWRGGTVCFRPRQGAPLPPSAPPRSPNQPSPSGRVLLGAPPAPDPPRVTRAPRVAPRTPVVSAAARVPLLHRLSPPSDPWSPTPCPRRPPQDTELSTGSAPSPALSRSVRTAGPSSPRPAPEWGLADPPPLPPHHPHPDSLGPRPDCGLSPHLQSPLLPVSASQFLTSNGRFAPVWSPALRSTTTPASRGTPGNPLPRSRTRGHMG